MTKTTKNNQTYSFRSDRVRVLAGASIGVLLAVTGCTSAQRRGLGEQDVRDALMMQVDKAVEGRGLSRDGKLDCTSSIASDSGVSASCTGATTSGEAITAKFIGLADLSAETCRAQLSIMLATNHIVDRSGVDCFQVK